MDKIQSGYAPVSSVVANPVIRHIQSEEFNQNNGVPQRPEIEEKDRKNKYEKSVRASDRLPRNQIECPLLVDTSSR